MLADILLAIVNNNRKEAQPCTVEGDGPRRKLELEQLELQVELNFKFSLSWTKEILMSQLGGAASGLSWDDTRGYLNALDTLLNTSPDTDALTACKCSAAAFARPTVFTVFPHHPVPHQGAPQRRSCNSF